VVRYLNDEGIFNFMKDKLAIITSGGGMACSYSSGAILALVEKFGIKNADIVIGSSGSTGTLAYYTSGQYDSIRNIWSNLLSGKRFINKKRFWKMIDIDYLVDDVFLRQDKLDLNKVCSSKTNLLITATNFDTGIVEYFTNDDKKNLFDALRASKAIPFTYNKKVSINGKSFFDGAISSSVESNALKAVEMGAKNLIIIDNDLTSSMSMMMFSLLVRLKNKKFRKNYQKNRIVRKNFNLPKDVNAVFLRPKKLGIGQLDNDKNLIKKTINQGYEETASNKKLINFLKEAGLYKG